jgi:hypothetical protein
MFRFQEVQDVASTLANQLIARRSGFTVAKLLIATTDFPGQSWLHLPLEDAAKFIRRRMIKYEDRKLRDRMFFDGDLIQFLAWSGRRKL